MSNLLDKVLHSLGRRIRDPYVENLASKIQTMKSELAGDSAGAVSARAAILVFLVRIISAIVTFALQVFLARWMGIEQYGIFILVWVVAVMLGSMSCLGLQTAVIRFITEYTAKNDIKYLKGIMLAAPIIAMLIATLVTLFTYFILFLFVDENSSIVVLPLYLALLCLPFLALEEIQEGIARSFDMPMIAIGPAFVIRPAGILMTMAIAYLLGFPANAMTALSSAVIATFVSTLIQSLILWLRIFKILGLKLPITNAIKLLDGNRLNIKFNFRYWFSIALPIFFASGFYGLLFNSDVILIGLMLGPESVAIYYAVLKSMALIHFVHFAFRAASTHHFSRFYSDNDIQGLSDFANKIAHWTFWPTLAIAIVTILTGKYILMLFGTTYVEAHYLLFILAAGIVLRATIGPIDALLAMTGQQSVVMGVLAITLLSNVILNVSLIPEYGILGAAIATSCVMFIETALMHTAVSRKLGLSIFVFNFGSKPIDERYAI